MARLRKIGRIFYSDLYIGGKRVRKPLSPDRRAAEEMLDDLMRDKDSRHYGHEWRDIPWGIFREKYMAYSRGSKAHWTQVRDESALRSLEEFEKPTRLIDITPELLERWKGARRIKGTGAATINREISAVKAMMKKAVLWRYLKSWDGSSVLKLKMTRGRLLFYSPTELSTLLLACRTYDSPYDYETIAMLGARAGLRPAEICWLAWEDVDLKRGVLSVTPKDGWQPKDKEQRHIPIDRHLSGHLSGLEKSSKWVIGQRPPAAALSVVFRKITKKAGLTGSLYTLRHTFASHLAQAGVSLYIIGELLGHSDPKMTMIYSHLQTSTLADAVTKLPDIL